MTLSLNPRVDRGGEHRRRASCRPIRPVENNGRFPYTGTISGPAKIIAGASGCMDLPRTRGMSALMASRYIPYRPDNGTWLNAAENHLALTTPARGAGMDGEMTPGMALEDMWI